MLSGCRRTAPQTIRQKKMGIIWETVHDYAPWLVYFHPTRGEYNTAESITRAMRRCKQYGPPDLQLFIVADPCKPHATYTEYIAGVTGEQRASAKLRERCPQSPRCQDKTPNGCTAERKREEEKGEIAQSGDNARKKGCG